MILFLSSLKQISLITSENHVADSPYLILNDSFKYDGIGSKLKDILISNFFNIVKVNERHWGENRCLQKK
ncbi:MAG: hypothetical protein EAX96_00360 [Candidatus Lokiarchaeota archaeon]|nr:hypothetical protein [Candidatus Lokiarchaeota archaeon]